MEDQPHQYPHWKRVRMGSRQSPLTYHNTDVSPAGESGPCFCSLAVDCQPIVLMVAISPSGRSSLFCFPSKSHLKRTLENVFSLRTTQFSHPPFCLAEIRGPKVQFQGVRVFYIQTGSFGSNTTLSKAQLAFLPLLTVICLQLIHNCSFFPDLIVGNLNLPGFDGKIMPLFMFFLEPFCLT